MSRAIGPRVTRFLLAPACVAVMAGWCASAPIAVDMSDGSPESGGRAAVVDVSPSDYQREMALARYRQENWAPAYLYYNDGELYDVLGPPWQLARLEPGQMVSGLSSALAEDTVVYAVTGAEGSRLYATSTAEPRPRLIADSAGLGEELWFRDPMGMSPVKDLVIVSVSAGRREWVTAAGARTEGKAAAASGGTGEVWLLDCAERNPPAAVLRGVRLVSCEWSPDGQFAACQSERPEEGGEIGVVDARNASYRKLLAGSGYVSWSADSSAVEVYRVTEEGGQALAFDPADGRLTRTSPTPGWKGFPEGTLWLGSATTAAWVEENAAGVGLRVGSVSGGGHRIALDSPPVRLLAWSYGARLVAFIGGDGTLRVACGLADLAGHERLVELIPEQHYPGAPKRGPLLAITKSPIRIRAHQSCKAAWAMGEKGPVLVYSDQEDGGGGGLWALPFERRSLEDGGLNPRLDLRKQYIARAVHSNLYELWNALLDYGRDHRGRFPTHVTGPGLAQELEPYLDRPDLLWSPYTPGEVRVRILMPGDYFPHPNFGRDASKAGEIPIVEFDGEEGITLRMYADGHVVSVGPDPPGFVSEEPY